MLRTLKCENGSGVGIWLQECNIRTMKLFHQDSGTHKVKSVVTPIHKCKKQIKKTKIKPKTQKHISLDVEGRKRKGRETNVLLQW